ncbi:nucleotidyl transferase AbiEii/AbiGii toxin family protein [Acidicapsa ligni]|uniref:nucleotidyl transferase AbiEii/AbiGii toxin family protein n=1 Tax=Acidicapsa ligni TaxID=542300 RepID=UPI0021E03B9D|nr:nucleotidyl transferase AbiEii/AbiGii toxin family protein [Acidicapsa ligni]
MPRETRNVGASVRARLLARSRAEGSDYQILLTRYALERLLYRLSVSVHSERFILKGALLFVTWLPDPFRPTRDLDLLGYGASTPEALADTFKAICSTSVPDDGVTFDVEGLTAAPIREDIEYGGVRVRTQAIIDGARIPIQVDIGFGDVITPGPVEIDYPALLDSPAPHLRAYPVETVIAEKFNAMVTLGIANSRLKDFYDLWLISRTFELDRAALFAAVQRTFEQRETPMPTGIPTGLTDQYGEQWGAQWKAFLKREHMNAAPNDLLTLIADLRSFLVPLTIPSSTDAYWTSGGPWSIRTK